MAPDNGNASVYAWSIDSEIRTRGKKHDVRLSINMKLDSNFDGSAGGSDDAAANVWVEIELFDSSGASVGRIPE